jgi:hypothetical protein
MKRPVRVIGNVNPGRRDLQSYSAPVYKARKLLHIGISRIRTLAYRKKRDCRGIEG